MAFEPSKTGRNAMQQLDELQRGQEQAPTVETMERLGTPPHGERREIPVPDPGERPGAVRAGASGPGEQEPNAGRSSGGEVGSGQ